MTTLLLSLTLGIIFIPLAIVVERLLASLDSEDVDSNMAPRQAQVRPGRRRIASALSWIALGCTIPTAVGVYYAHPGVWAGIAVYVLLNLGGTLYALAEFKSKPRASRALKTLFVLQVPIGIVIFIGNGI
ncbi:MAG: hypothetical protein AAGA65_16545 [Actinomycetota bacterium]